MCDASLCAESRSFAGGGQTARGTSFRAREEEDENLLHELGAARAQWEQRTGIAAVLRTYILYDWKRISVNVPFSTPPTLIKKWENMRTSILANKVTTHTCTERTNYHKLTKHAIILENLKFLINLSKVLFC